MADGNQQQRGTPRKKTALDEFKLRLVGEPVNGAKRPPTLGFSIVKNLPQIDVRTNVESDKDYGRISAKLDQPTFFAVMELINKAIEGPNDSKTVVKNFAHRFINGKRSDPMLDSQIVVGKDASGVVYMGVMSWEKERPIIKFPFRPSQYAKFSNSDGTEMSLADVSVLYGKGYLKMLHGLIPLVLASEYVEPPPRDPQQGGGGYGGGQGGGNRGGYNGGQGGGNRGGGEKWGGGGNGNSGGASDGLDDFPM